jgi:hypothetical protein
MTGFLKIISNTGVGEVLIQPLSNEIKKGKWYWELCLPDAHLLNLDNLKTIRTGIFSKDKKNKVSDLGDDKNSYAWRSDGYKVNNNIYIKHGKRLHKKYSIIMTAVDVDQKKIWFGINGNWINSNPESNTGESFNFKNKSIIPAVSSMHSKSGYFVSTIPSAINLNCYKAPKGFLPLSPGIRNIIPKPIILKNIKKNDTKENYFYKKIEKKFYFFKHKLLRILEILNIAKIHTPMVFKLKIIDHENNFQTPSVRYENKNFTSNEFFSISDMTKDLKKREIYFKKIEEKFLENGNFFMAKKIFRQSEIFNPSSNDTIAKGKWYDSLESLGYIFDSSLNLQSNQTNEQLFDFVYIPTEKCGSTAHIALLSLHPESTVLTNTEVQGSFYHNNEKSLLIHSQRHVFKDTYKSGLVMDARISGARQQPSGIITDSSYAMRMSKIIKSDGFFQAIRNPLGIAKSTFNSNILLYDLGSYKFTFTNPKSIFNLKNLVKIKNEKINSKKIFEKRNILKIDKNIIYERMEFAARIFRPYSIGKSYADYFDKWNIIDLDKNKKHSNRMMFQTYKKIGLNTKYIDLLENIPFRDKVQFVMQNNKLRISIYDTELNISLGRALQSSCTNDDNLIEIYWFDISDQAKELGIHDTLCICVDVNNWNTLSPYLKEKIINSNDLKKFFIEIYLPIWLDDFKLWLDFVSPFLINKFDISLKNKIINTSQKEITSFLKKHPQVEDSWNEIF